MFKFKGVTIVRVGSGFLFNILLGDIEYYSSLHSLAKSKWESCWAKKYGSFPPFLSTRLFFSISRPPTTYHLPAAKEQEVDE